MPGTITEEDARYAFGIVERICREAGPGLRALPKNGSGLLSSGRNWGRTQDPVGIPIDMLA